MSIRLSFAAGALLALATFSAQSAAQLQAFSANTDRKTTQVFLFTQEGGGFNVRGLVSVHYGQPMWKDEYAGMIETTKPGVRARLGKDLWTTLDTSCPLQIGEQTLAPGYYYLAVEMGEEGVINLVVLEPKEVHEQGLNPSTAADAKGGVVVPMQRKDGLEVQKVLGIELRAGEEPTDLALVLRWGPLETTAVMKAVVKA